jgi:hypothetical protein
MHPSNSDFFLFVPKQNPVWWAELGPSGMVNFLP